MNFRPALSRRKLSGHMTAHSNDLPPFTNTDLSGKPAIDSQGAFQAFWMAGTADSLAKSHQKMI